MMGLRRPGAVVCDLDGTLVDTVPTRIRAWLRTFSEVGLAADRDHVASLIGSDGKWLAEQVAARAGRELSGGESETIDRRAGELYGELNTEPHVLPGASAFIAALRAAGIPWAIATSSRPEQVSHSVAALGLPEPPVVVDGLQVRRAKPAPDLLLAAAEALGAQPDVCWCVGDSRWDVRAATAAGMIPIGVATGPATREELGGDGAQVVVDRLDELVDAL
ncbi:MAG: HAD family hydrolase [Candidatus Limnocylindria bacterium]